MISFQVEKFKEPTFIDILMSRAEAWRQWEVSSCEEFNGKHSWVMVLYNSEEDAAVEMNCENCPVGVNDIMPDGQNYLYADMHGWNVSYGMHSRNDIEDYLEIRVNLDVIVEKYGPNLDMIYPEYDVYLEITPRKVYTSSN